MDDSKDDRPSGLSPLFIQEEDSIRSIVEQGESSRQPSGSAEARLKDSAQMKPYLQEMDDLLKSCSELTGISESSHRNERSEASSEASEESSFQAYLSTSYIDTHMDGAGAGSEPGLGSIILSSRGGATEASPLTSAGNRLSQSMVEYEGQLMGMLAMLERCMEEAVMDFEPQDWTPDSAQEYVHISKNPRCSRGTTHTDFIPEEMETHPTQSESSSEEDKVSMDDESRNQENPPLCCQKMDHFGKGKPDPPPLFMFSGLLLSTEQTEEHSGTRDETPETVLSGIDSQEAESQEFRKTFSQESTLSTLGNLHSVMDVCIDQVQQLQRKRRELLVEVLGLRSQKDEEEEEKQSQNEEELEELMESKVVELMNVFRKEEEARRVERKREIQDLKEERAEEEKKVWKMDLERQGLQEQIRTLKSRLFSLVRDCMFSQAALNHQRRQLELQKIEEERLQGLLLQLTEDGCRLRSDHQQHLKDLQTKLDALNSRSCSSQEELGRCRRHSCGDVKQFMQRERKALEERFEPILLALLKRRDATAGALHQAKEQSQELRAQLTPLREEVQKLLLQRACLGEKVKLVQLQRQEEAERFKEKLFHLEENSRTMRMELEIQRRKNREMEETREILSKQLLLHRAANKDGDDREEKN